MISKYQWLTCLLFAKPNIFPFSDRPQLVFSAFFNIEHFSFKNFIFKKLYHSGNVVFKKKDFT
jgi:hypothetical protein